MSDQRNLYRTAQKKVAYSPGKTPLNVFEHTYSYIRSYGFTHAVKQFLRDPSNIMTLFSPQPHFYLLEQDIPQEEFVRFVLELSNTSTPAKVERYRQEIRSDAPLRRSVEQKLKNTTGRPNKLHHNWRELLYVLCRIKEPDIAVETGVYDGLSSLYILRALEKNDNGELLSIDINDTELFPDNINSEPQCGWLVPESLRARWTLRIGDAKEQLADIAGEYDFDVFLHDSLHTEDHMRFEFETAVMAMDTGGLVLSDNIEYNDVFDEFAAEYFSATAKVRNTRFMTDIEGDETVDRLGGGVVRKAGQSDNKD